MEGAVVDVIKRVRYWAIKNFSGTLSDAKLSAYEAESEDGFYRQLTRIHKNIVEKPEIVEKK